MPLEEIIETKSIFTVTAWQMSMEIAQGQWTVTKYVAKKLKLLFGSLKFKYDVPVQFYHSCHLFLCI